MPNDTAFVIPQAEREKILAKAASTDFYSELTDEERAEEGLEPRAKPNPEPEAKPVAKDPEPSPVAVAAEELEVDDDSVATTQALFDEIASLRETLETAMEPEEVTRAEETDTLLAAAKDHDDPVVRGLAERLERAETQLKENDKAIRGRVVAEQLHSDNLEFEAVQKNTLIDGQPMTAQHVEQVEDYMLEHPAIARELSIEAVTRVVFPGASRVGKQPPTDKPRVNGTAKATADGAPTAIIVDDSSGGGATGPEPFKPRPNETMDSAMQAFGRRVGWVK